jgi:hypothetical protein
MRQPPAPRFAANGTRSIAAFGFKMTEVDKMVKR